MDTQRILVSLDFKLCFDHVLPDLALRNMEHYGAPPRLLEVLRWTWNSQWRWLQMGADTLEEPKFVSTSLPQGCPASPLALLLLLRRPALQVQEELEGRATQAVYVDDRNLVVSTAVQARRAADLWEAKATALGLRENRGKRKFVTRQQRALRAQGLETRNRG